MEAVTTSRNGFQRTGRRRIESTFPKNFKSCTCFQLLSVKRKCLRPPEIVSKNRKTSTRINIFENTIQIRCMFSTFIKSNGSIYNHQKWFSENRKTSYRINIFEKIQVLFMFSTIISQTEVFTTSVNSFQKTGSSYDVVPNQHFREQNSNPIHVFDFCQVKWKRLWPPEMVSREPEEVITSYRINVFEKFQVMYMFSTLSSPMEAFTTSRNCFQRTGSSYDILSS